MKEKTRGKSRMFKGYDIIAIVFLALAVVIAPWLFSQHASNITFDRTGQIGDTIGGITSPFVGLLGAYLVFIGFRAQLEANQLISKQRHEDLAIQNINNIINRIERLIDEFSFNGKHGTDAIYEFSNVNLFRVIHLLKKDGNTVVKESFKADLENNLDNGLSRQLLLLSETFGLVFVLFTKLEVDIDYKKTTKFYIDSLFNTCSEKTIEMMKYITLMEQNYPYLSATAYFNAVRNMNSYVR